MKYKMKITKNEENNNKITIKYQEKKKKEWVL